ncbi:Ribonuclease H domain [Sesbania bispinosa]|nr:Ribonuclease H domain [Sesbania bispinosa]
MFHTVSLRLPVPRWVGWSPHTEDCAILNTDGSVAEAKAGFGGVIRLHDGSWVQGFCGNLDGAEIIEVELVGIFQGLRLCHRLELAKVHCQTDSLTAVKWIQEGVSPCHRFANLVTQIWELLSLPWNASITHVLRECNRCADFCAKMGLLCLDRFKTFSSP